MGNGHNSAQPIGDGALREGIFTAASVPHGPVPRPGTCCREGAHPRRRTDRFAAQPGRRAQQPQRIFVALGSRRRHRTERLRSWRAARRIDPSPPSHLSTLLATAGAEWGRGKRFPVLPRRESLAGCPPMPADRLPRQAGRRLTWWWVGRRVPHSNAVLVLSTPANIINKTPAQTG